MTFSGLFCALLSILVLPGESVQVIQSNSVVCQRDFVQFQIDPSLPIFDSTSKDASNNPLGLLYIEPGEDHPTTCLAQQGKGFPASTVTTPQFLYSDCKFNWTIISQGGNQEYLYLNIPVVVYQQSGNVVTPRSNYTSYIYCLIPSQIHVHTGVNDTGGGGGGGGGGGTPTVTTDVEMLLTDSSGADMNGKSVSDNTPLVLKLRLNETQEDYNATLPYSCWFSDGSPNSNLYFIANGCPNTGLINGIDALGGIWRYQAKTPSGTMDWVYEVHFDAFSIGESTAALTTLNVYCDLLLCVDTARCTPPSACNSAGTPYNATSAVQSVLFSTEERATQTAEMAHLLAAQTNDYYTNKRVGVVVTFAATPAPSASFLGLSVGEAVALFSGIGFFALLSIILCVALCCWCCMGAGCAGFGMRRKPECCHYCEHGRHGHQGHHCEHRHHHQPYYLGADTLSLTSLDSEAPSTGSKLRLTRPDMPYYRPN